MLNVAKADELNTYWSPTSEAFSVTTKVKAVKTVPCSKSGACTWKTTPTELTPAPFLVQGTSTGCCRSPCNTFLSQCLPPWRGRARDARHRCFRPHKDHCDARSRALLG